MGYSQLTLDLLIHRMFRVTNKELKWGNFSPIFVEKSCRLVDFFLAKVFLRNILTERLFFSTKIWFANICHGAVSGFKMTVYFKISPKLRKDDWHEQKFRFLECLWVEERFIISCQSFNSHVSFDLPIIKCIKESSYIKSGPVS